MQDKPDFNFKKGCALRCFFFFFFSLSNFQPAEAFEGVLVRNPFKMIVPRATPGWGGGGRRAGGRAGAAGSGRRGGVGRGPVPNPGRPGPQVIHQLKVRAPPPQAPPSAPQGPHPGPVTPKQPSASPAP